jgi:hypothetical protein
MSTDLHEQTKKLKWLAYQLRITGLGSLGLTIGNLLLLAVLFAIFFNNQQIFKGHSPTYRAEDLQKVLTVTLIFGSTIFIACLTVLYLFDQFKREVQVITGEVFDEVGWHSTGASNSVGRIGLDDRIAIRTVGKNASLPFLSESQGVAVYVLINFLLFLAVAVVDLYLIQTLNAIISP